MVPAAAAARFAELLRRRLDHTPVAHLLGTQEFWSLRFAVSPATLIPRADSESLIEAAIEAFPDRGAVRRVLDLGTGTGCLLLAALHEFAGATGLGVDRVPAAAALARQNAGDLGLADRARFVVADWAAPITGRFDLVLCNPPYIESAGIPGLMPDVARHRTRLGAGWRGGWAGRLPDRHRRPAGPAGARRAGGAGTGAGAAGRGGGAGPRRRPPAIALPVRPGGGGAGAPDGVTGSSRPGRKNRLATRPGGVSLSKAFVGRRAWPG